jgi:hypothetical protein
VSSSTSSASTSTSQSHVNFTDSNSQADSTQSSSHIQQDKATPKVLPLTSSSTSTSTSHVNFTDSSKEDPLNTQTIDESLQVDNDDGLPLFQYSSPIVIPTPPPLPPLSKFHQPQSEPNVSSNTNKQTFRQELKEKSSTIGLKTNDAVKDYETALSFKTESHNLTSSSISSDTDSSLLGKLWRYVSGNTTSSTSSIDSTQVPITPLNDSSNPVAQSTKDDSNKQWVKSSDGTWVKSKFQSKSSPESSQTGSSHKALPFTAQIKELGPQDDNLKPSHFNAKFKYIIPENTKITENIQASDISDADALFEMKSRGLIKHNKDQGIVTFKTENGQDVTLGGSLFKFSQLGIAYAEQQDKPKTFIPNTSDTLAKEDCFELKLAVIPPEKEAFFPSAKEKHLVVAYNKNSSECHVIGYLTSKSTGDFISKKQFKVYQDEREGIINNDKPKDQRFKKFDNAESIPKNNLTFILGGNDYIRDTAIGYFEDLRTKLKQLPSNIFNPNEFTKDNGIKLCQAYDKNVTEKKSQPKSKDQIKMDNENQVKQTNINEQKKLKATMSQQETTTLESHEDKTK